MQAVGWTTYIHASFRPRHCPSVGVSDCPSNTSMDSLLLCPRNGSRDDSNGHIDGHQEGHDDGKRTHQRTVCMCKCHIAVPLTNRLCNVKVSQSIPSNITTKLDFLYHTYETFDISEKLFLHNRVADFKIN